MTFKNAEPEVQPVEGLRDAAAIEELDDQLREVIGTLYHLSDEQIRRIEDAAVKVGLSFKDASVQSGVLTAQELDRALHWMQDSSSRGGSGIIERALRRRPQRALVVREGPRLRARPEVVLAHEPQNPRSEALRSLRTEILLRNKSTRGSKPFALVSPGRGDGRTQLCAELAVAFGQLGNRTLLVDADMRHPRLHELFGSSNEVGLAQMLANEANVVPLSVEGVDSLAVLPSGPQPPNPLELLSGRGFEQLIIKWMRHYEHIIIDTPATSEFSDAIAVAAVVGHVVVVGKTGDTRYTAMTNLTKELETTHARVVGAVMNSF